MFGKNWSHSSAKIKELHSKNFKTGTNSPRFTVFEEYFNWKNLSEYLEIMRLAFHKSFTFHGLMQRLQTGRNNRFLRAKFD